MKRMHTNSYTDPRLNILSWFFPAVFPDQSNAHYQISAKVLKNLKAKNLKFTTNSKLVRISAADFQFSLSLMSMFVVYLILKILLTNLNEFSCGSSVIIRMQISIRICIAL